MNDLAEKLVREEEARMRELQALARQINERRRKEDLRLAAALVILMTWLAVTGIALGAELALQGRWGIIPGLAIVAPLAWACVIILDHLSITPKL